MRVPRMPARRYSALHAALLVTALMATSLSAGCAQFRWTEGGEAWVKSICRANKECCSSIRSDPSCLGR